MFDLSDSILSPFLFGDVAIGVFLGRWAYDLLLGRPMFWTKDDERNSRAND